MGTLIYLPSGLIQKMAFEQRHEVGKSTILHYNLEDRLFKQSKQPVPTFKAEMCLVSFQGMEKRPVWLKQTLEEESLVEN